MLVTLGIAVGSAFTHASADDGDVFLYKDRQGRQVYTNLEGMASHGQALTRVTLPPLSSVDFAHSPPDALRALDRTVSESHNALQSGAACEAIRKSSRVPMRTKLWTEHGPKLGVSAGLLLFAGMVGAFGARRKLGSLFPLVPIAGSAFVGYASYHELHAERASLTSGLRACSEQLPDGDPEDGASVKGRLQKALDLQHVVDSAYQRQAERIDAILQER